MDDGGATKRQDRRAYAIAAVVIAVAFVGAVATSGMGAETSPTGNSREAVAQCEGFADRRLKAPVTADYELTAIEEGDVWTVIGTVDSENGFGAKIRSDVECVLHFADDMAVLDSIMVG